VADAASFLAPSAFNGGIKWQKAAEVCNNFQQPRRGPRANLTRAFRQRKGVMNVPEALLYVYTALQFAFNC